MRRTDGKQPWWHLYRDVGIDLGIANVRAIAPPRGIIVKEPCVAAVDKTTDILFAFGSEARSLTGKIPQNLEILQPQRTGGGEEFEWMLRILQYCIRTAGNGFLRSPHAMVTIPSDAAPAEEAALVRAAREAGAGRVYLIEEIEAAALGAGVDISRPSGRLVVHLGGGHTDVALFSMGGIVVRKTVPVGGNRMDEAIVRYVQQNYGILVVAYTGERIKESIGALYTHNDARSVMVRGRSVETGLPETVTLYSREMLGAMTEPVTAIMDAICFVIEHTPAELLGDVRQNGIVLTGGTALIWGFDRLISRVTGVPVRVAEDPLYCPLRGTLVALEQKKTRREGVLHPEKKNRAGESL